MKLLYLLRCPLVLCLLVFQLALGADREKVHVGPAPEWTVALDYDPEGAPAEDQETLGVFLLLLDSQHHVESRQYFRRTVRRVLNEAGVQEEGTVQITFNPAFQELTLHAIRIIRNGVKLNRLELDELRIIQRENELERNIFDGTVSVLLILEDLRVGDLVETAYTLTGANPVFGEKFSMSSYLQWSVPVATQQIRVVAPLGRPLWTKAHQSGIEPEITDRDGMREMVWLGKNLQPLRREGHLPEWYDAYPWLQVTEYASWQEVAVWGAGVYPFGSVAPEELLERVRAIREEHSRPEDQVVAAIRLVQDEVRYTGVNLGEHSHAPNAPERVVKRRFGDCKDKSYLLCTLLRELGIEAWPAVVDTNENEYVERWLPTPFAFNHVIVQLRIGGREYWVDATISHQRGSLEKLPMLPYGKALLLKPDEVGLVPVVGSNHPGCATLIKERFEIGEGEAPTTLHVETSYTGSRADSIRSYLARSSRSDVEKNYEEYYATWWSTVRWDGRLEWEDDEVANILTVRESYSIPKIWDEEDDDHLKSIYFRAQGVRSHIDKASAHRRSMPLKVPYPLAIEQIIEVKLPGDWEIEPEETVVEDESVRFQRSVRYDERLLTMRYELATLKDHVMPEQAAAHVANLTKIENDTSYYIFTPLHAAGPEPEEIEAADSPNWAMWVTTLFVLIGSVWVGWWIVRFRPVVPAHGEWVGPGLSGIGGWLLLVGLGLVLSVPRAVISCFSYLPFYGMSHWSLLTTPGQESYHFLWAPVILLESGATILLAVLVVAVLVLFVKKRTGFPRAMVGLYLLGLGTALFSTGSAHLLSFDQADIETAWLGLTRATVGAAIWVPYLMVSKRVKATFIN